MPEPILLFSCEHAVNRVPEGLRGLFEDREDLLDSHRAYDAGALGLAEELAQRFDAPLFRSHVTRLLIDHNRSPRNPGLWSEFSRDLEPGERCDLVQKYYRPFRARVAAWIAEQTARGHRVVHIAVHSFTPILNGNVRSTDVGFLYDPVRTDETGLASVWQKELQRLRPGLRVHRNRPYRGVSDCHQRSYRLLYDAQTYIALELEFNQKLLGGGQGGWVELRRQLADSLAAAVRGRAAAD